MEICGGVPSSGGGVGSGIRGGSGSDGGSGAGAGGGGVGSGTEGGSGSGTGTGPGWISSLRPSFFCSSANASRAALIRSRDSVSASSRIRLASASASRTISAARSSASVSIFRTRSAKSCTYCSASMGPRLPVDGASTRRFPRAAA